MTRFARGSAPSVVGLDPSWTSFGIAHVDGTTEAIRTTSEYEDRIRIKILTSAVTSATWRADLVVIEGYAHGAKFERERLGHLSETIKTRLLDISVPYVTIPPSTLKKWATGSGRASKKEMKDSAVSLLGLSPRASHDEADALWLRAAGLHLLGASDRLPPSGHAEALDKIRLPEGLKR